MPTNKEDPTATRAPGTAETSPPAPAGTVAVHACTDIGAEAVRFVWDRLHHDLKTQQAMMACTSLQEMRKIQAEFFTAVQEQYAAEAAKMLDLMGKAASAALAPAPKGRRYDDVPL
ncbi:MAG: phasin family protein [Pseudorhodobacter sp.]|nr:phasin family protein [Pseudorhodobacter sp.]